MKFNGRSIFISPSAKIGVNVRVGDNTIIYDNVIIGDNTTICNDCVIGEPLNSYYSKSDYDNPPTVIGANSTIRSHTIIYASVKTGNSFSTGHRVTIRENTIIGSHCRFGTLSDIQGNINFGDYCWLHSNVHIGQTSKIGSYVFIYPYVVFTNDPHPPSNICIGPTIEDFAQIAVGAIILPNSHIGKHTLIGANSVVGGKVEDYALVVGNPAKKVKDVRELISRETGRSHYPWPYNFERGMPWEGIGFEQWQNSNLK